MLITRRKLLQAMLGALALAAVSGVLALVVSNAETVWRVAGTSFAIAIAAAVMMPMASWADKPLTRRAGLIGMCIAIAELVLGSVLIWGDLLPGNLREFVGWSTLIVGVGGLMSVRFLRDTGLPGWRFTAWTGACACALASLLFLLAAALESFLPSGSLAQPLNYIDELFQTGWGVFASGVLGSMALIGLHRPDNRPWRWAGITASAVALGLVLYGAWFHHEGNPAWIVGCYCTAGVVAHAIGCLRLSLTPVQGWVRLIAIGSALLTGGMVTFCAAVDSRIDPFDSFAWQWRITAASALICASTSLALVVFGRLNKRPVVELDKTKFDSVTLFCPRCQKKLTLPTGGSLCPSCRLHIHVSVQAARCAQCGYNLDGLRDTDRCPECNAPVPLGATGLAEATN